MYFITTIFTVGYYGGSRHVANGDIDNLKISLIQLTKNIFLIQSWFPSGWYSFNGVGWFLSSIMFLYSLNIPFTSVGTKIKNTRYPIFIFITISIFTNVMAYIYCYSFRNENLEFWAYIFPPAHIFEYIIGICLGYIVKNIVNVITDSFKTKIVFSLFEIMALIVEIYFLNVQVGGWQSRIIHWIIPNSILLMVFAIGKGYISQWFQMRFLKHLGDISFECFLLHQIIIYCYSVLSAVGNVSRYGNIFSLIYCLVMTVFFAELIHRE